MTPVTVPIAATAPLVSTWIVVILRLISSVALAVCLASSFTSFCNYREAISCLSCSSCLYRCIQSKQVGLLRNRSDHLDDNPNVRTRLAQLSHCGVGSFSGAHC